MAGVRGEEWALECEGSAVVEVGGGGVGGGGEQATNDLGGLGRRKKRKVDDGEAGQASGDQALKEVEPAAAAAGVNVLVGRKKAKN